MLILRAYFSVDITNVIYACQDNGLKSRRHIAVKITGSELCQKIKKYLIVSGGINLIYDQTVLKGKLPTTQNKCSVLKFLFLFLDLGVVIHNPWLQIPPLLFFCG